MQKEAILVTGANSGIGFEITKLLNKQGKFVLAGYRREETISIFDHMEFVQPVLLDVTKKETVNEIKEFLNKDNLILKGLVNNAGTTNSLIPLYYTSVEDMKRVFDVNVFGMHAITQACIPDLIKSKGRIVIISSVAGVQTGYFSGTYSMTKHAVEAYTDALSYELKKFDIHVSAIEPGSYLSNMGKGNEINIEKLVNFNSNIYMEELVLIKNWLNSPHEKTDPEPIDVAEAVYHALFDPNPKIRYLTTSIALETEKTIKKIIIELLQLNKDNKFSYSCEELVRMIRELYNTDLKGLHFAYIPEPFRM